MDSRHRTPVREKRIGSERFSAILGALPEVGSMPASTFEFDLEIHVASARNIRPLKRRTSAPAHRRDRRRNAPHRQFGSSRPALPPHIKPGPDASHGLSALWGRFVDEASNHRACRRWRRCGTVDREDLHINGRVLVDQRACEARLLAERVQARSRHEHQRFGDNGRLSGTCTCTV